MVRFATSTKTSDTSTRWANSCVTIEMVFGGNRVWKRSGTTAQFIAK